MRISIPTGKDLWSWHRWFAWHPVVIGGEIIWMEAVERKLAGGPNFYTYFEYRATTPTEATP